MAKKTLLEIVQNILNDMDSDEVNSINDTVESQQVANIVKTCYQELISNRNWAHLKKLTQLEASNSTLLPTHLILPEGTKELIMFKYDKAKKTDTKVILGDVTYKAPEEFLRYIYQRDSSKPVVTKVSDIGGTQLLIYNDRAPQYWTSFDDKYIVCDSYDKNIDDTLKKSKTQILAYIETPWQHDDLAVPNLPEEAFSLLEEEAKSTAFINLKQMANQKAEQKAARQNRWLSRKAWRAHGGIQYPDYGRKARR